ncbi:MAG: multidrug ABC transporter ATP-binding protein [Halobacteriovoraceae bacterium]|nr:multidrug ABC transporter ATP-binding protein [Halobacteriovoraceae bacterium]
MRINRGVNSFFIAMLSFSTHNIIMLEFVNITKTFSSDILKKPFTAVDGLSFTIDAGKTIGFLGANGAGKTTSIKMAMDFIRPTSGEILYGKELGNKKIEAFSKMGYLPERPFFYPHLTGFEFCQYMGALSDISAKEVKKQIKKWAPEFKIDFALDRQIKTYSKGMLQRVGFLATLIHDPKLIILDEPLAGVDPVGRKELKDIIEELKLLGKTVFFSSHIVSDVEEICDNVLFIKNGKLLFDGSVDKIINENIKSEYRVRYYKDNELCKILVEDKEKNKSIESLIKDGADIISVEQERMSLEQIFYNVK